MKSEALIHILLPTLLLLSHYVYARDPFLPVEVQRCSDESSEISDWVLQGITEQADLYHGWLFSPRKGLVRMDTGQEFPGTDWKVREITLSAVTFAGKGACQKNNILLMMPDDRYAGR